MSAWSQIDDFRDRVAASDSAALDGALDEAREVLDSKGLDEAREALRKSNLMPDRLVVMGWEILLSRRRENRVVLWHLSTKLHPYGRSSTEHDWKVLGKIAARVGAPRDPVIMPDDPSAAVHWSWVEQ